MIKKLLIGTGNPAKFLFYRRCFSDAGLQLVSPEDLNIPAPAETGGDFEENAQLKAVYYAEKSGMSAISDDAGLEIPALKNFPAIVSKRFVGDNPSEKDIIGAISAAMKDLRGKDRRARFVVSVCLAVSPEITHTARGSIDGRIPEKPFEKVMPNFPYRSLLFVDALDKWFYELTDAQEEQIGYRKAAVESLKKYLN